ncbi:hypothetical protein [Halomonas sp.]|uniref:hypothetical protein n=1 Tax=Halomonas sp. TaxID=1486246 RepID=UPI003D10AEC6
MSRIDDLIEAQLKTLPPKPDDKSSSTEKKRYSEQVSQVVALAVAEELRHRGLEEARPAGEGVLGGSGAERRMAGGLGSKKVDVTWATEESGLLMAISVKTINFKDNRTNNYQKNLTNRRGDMLMEAVTLHRRFPYSVLAAFFFLDSGAEKDGTGKRRSTFINAHARLRLFTDRKDPAGREEQYEKFYLILLEASPDQVNIRPYRVGDPDNEISLSLMLDELLELVAERNPDFYEYSEGQLTRL